MIDFEIKKTEKIFIENFPKEITDKTEFYKQCRFIKLAPVLFIETIANYKTYLENTGFQCKKPEEFLKNKMYLIDYKLETKTYIDNRQSNRNSNKDDIPSGWTYWENLQDMLFYYKNELEHIFRNKFQYGEYHEVVNYQYKFEVQFRQHEDGYILNEKNCNVRRPWMDDYKMENFNKFSPDEQLKMLIDITWKREPYETQREFIQELINENRNLKPDGSLEDFDVLYYKKMTEKEKETDIDF